MPNSIVVLNRIGRTFLNSGAVESVISDFSIEVTKGEVLSICGRSGSGKTTLLRIISGLDSPTSGSVLVDGQPPSNLYPRIGYVVQDYSQSLLPWLKIQANVSLALLKSGLSRKERLLKADELLELVGLGQAKGKYPWQLSGGMQQRVAIARALCVDPVLLCLDEPFASLDAQTRSELQDLVLKVAAEKAVTTIIVTHDLDEAVYMADRVVVLNATNGKSAVVEVSLPKPRAQKTTRYLQGFLDSRQKVEALFGKPD